MDSTENEGKPWTVQLRELAWQTYLSTPKGTGVWGRMSRLTGKTVKACQTEIWKLHRNDAHSGASYWDKGGRQDVRLSGRGDLPWSVNEKTALLNAFKSKLPLDRIAELFGRSEDQCRQKHDEVLAESVNKGRRPFGLRG